MIRRGFTIVELLIVIVVIAILAAISIVAYNGIQERANNSARLQEVAQIMQLFKLYQTAYDDYPGVTAGSKRCIGTGYPNGQCGTAGSYVSESNLELTDKLREMGSPPSTQYAVGSAHGPYINAWGDGWGFDMYIHMQGESSEICPDALPHVWYNDPSSNRLDCGNSFGYKSQYGA